MEMHELEKKTDAELRTHLRDLKKEIHELEFQAANGQLKNVRTLRHTKKDIARIQTIISARARISPPAQVTTQSTQS